MPYECDRLINKEIMSLAELRFVSVRFPPNESNGELEGPFDDVLIRNDDGHVPPTSRG